MKVTAVIVLSGILCATGLRADFSYEQTSQITGGMMASMMKLAGAFSKKAREPIKTNIMVKGNRMVSATADSVSITDLDKETITEVNYQKKTYSVMTFQQLREFMEQAAAKSKSKDGDAQMNVKVSVKDGGQAKTINGLNTKLMIMTIETEITDPKNKQSGTMVVTSDMWLAPSVPGYEEVREFYKRMAAKIAYAPGSGFGNMGGEGIGKGMSALYKEGAKLDGVPVFQIVRMGMVGEQIDPANTQAAAEAQQEAEQRRAQQPTAGQVAAGAATNSAASGAGRAIGGKAGSVVSGLGGLGGFGRKKKPAEQPQEAPPPPPPPAQTQQASSTPPPAAAPGSLMVMSSELTGFAPTADASKFEVPAGFKQVEAKGKR